MKKCTYVFAAMLFATASVVFVSCKDEVDKNLESDYNENQKVAEMTPDEQKDYLVEVGKEFAATLNPNDQRAAADLASGLYRKYESWNWDLIGNQMEDELNKLDAQGFFRMPARIAAMATGETATLDAKEFFVSFVVAGRLFEFDDKTKTVKISTTKDGSIIARFKDENGTDCELKVWGEGKTSTMSYTYEDYHWESVYDEYGNWIEDKKVYDGTRTIRAEVPAEIHMYLKQGSKEIMTLAFTWESNFKSNFNHSLIVKVTNVTWSQEANVSTKEANAAFSLMYGDKKLLVAAVDVPKYRLIDWNGGANVTEEEAENWIEQYDAKYESILGTLGKGEGQVDILGKVRGKMSVKDGAAFYDAMKQYERTNYATDLEEETAYCKVLNDYVYVGLYYGGKTEQAQVKMQPSYSWTDDYTGVKYYESLPVLYFPKDGTTYEVTTFFESTKFNVLIDLAEDLINAYKDLDTGHIIFDGGRIELN